MSQDDFDIDLDNAPSSPRRTVELLPTGSYLVEIDWAERTLSNRGTQRVTFKFKITSGVNEGRTFREDIYTTPNAIWKLKLLARAVALPPGTPLKTPKDLLDAFQGKQLKVVLSKDEYTDAEGAKREARKISVFESLDPKVRAEMDAERKARLGGGGGGGSASGGGGGGSASGSRRPTPDNVVEDDDIPF